MLDSHEVKVLAALGRYDDIINIIDRRDREGTDPWNTINLSINALHAYGHSEAALQMSRVALDWLSTRPVEEKQSEDHRALKASVLYRAEQWDESRDIYEELNRENPRSYNLSLALVAARLDDREEALRRLDLGAALYRGRKYYFGEYERYKARVYAQLGEPEEAIRFLRQALQNYQVYHVRYMWDLEPLHGNPEFEALIAPKG
jgi:tetratricopeptide (TPR) repeat protein